MKEDAKAGGSAMHKLADHVERIGEGGQLWIAVAAGFGLLLMQIPGLDNLLAKLGLETSPQIRTIVVVILLTTILLELRQLKRSLTPAISGREHYPGPEEMYEALIEKAGAIDDAEHHEIDVLGLTLYSAWPWISFFLERPEVNNWTVRLATLSKDATEPLKWVPGGWPQESTTTVNQVLEFTSNHAAKQNHQIEVFEYEFTPAVHGFRLGTGDVFISTLHWQEDGRLGKHRFSYDYVPGHDVSPEAAAVRKLFENWFDRAVSSASEASNPVG